MPDRLPLNTLYLFEGNSESFLHFHDAGEVAHIRLEFQKFAPDFSEI